MAKQPLDWTRTGTAQAMGEWVRTELSATVVLAVRARDAVFLVDPQTTPVAAGDLVLLYLPRLVEQVALERKGKYHTERDGALKGRAEWLLRESDGICVLVIRPHDSLLLVDGRCKPEDAEQLVLEYLPELAAVVGESAKYKGARLVMDAYPE